MLHSFKKQMMRKNKLQLNHQIEQKFLSSQKKIKTMTHFKHRKSQIKQKLIL